MEKGGECMPSIDDLLNKISDFKCVVDGKEIKVKAQDVQRHPYKPKLLHIDFVRA